MASALVMRICDLASASAVRLRPIARPRRLQLCRHKAGTPVWIDIDRTGASLDTVVELITEQGTIIAQSDNSLAESQAVAADNRVRCSRLRILR